MKIEKPYLFEKIIEQEMTAKQFGFYWENIEQVLEQIRSECEEVKEAYQNNNSEHLKEEVGDLLQAAMSLSIFCNVDPLSTLEQSVKKFQVRYDTLLKITKEKGYNSLVGYSNNDLMELWQEVKQRLSIKE